MLTPEHIEQAKRLTGDARAKALAAIARQLSEDLLYDLRENILSFDRHYGKAHWEHPGGFLVSISIHRDAETGNPLGFLAELRGQLIPLKLCTLGFAYIDPADTALVLQKCFGLNDSSGE